MSEPLRSLVDCLRTIASKHQWEGMRDGELLASFIETHNNDVFACLMRRHGPMVLSLARRIVRDQQLAEDVFQATFLILARKTRSIRGRDSLPAWLHNVALRLAIRAKKSNKRWLDRLTRTRRVSPANPLDELSAREFLAICDEELARLPEKYRLPLILCQLEGLSQEAAAKRLNVVPGALKGMLERGKTLLRKRLATRGLPAGAVLAGGLELGGPIQAVSSTLLQSTLHAAVTSQGASAAAVALAEGAIMMMMIAKIKTVCLAVLVLAALGSGAGWMAMAAGNGQKRDRAPELKPAVKALAAVQSNDKPKRVDLYGDPLPDGAVARLGTTRLRQGDGVNWLQFTADGKGLISQGNSGVRIWDPATGERLQFFADDRSNGNAMPHSSTSLSTDGKLLALAGKDGIYLHEVTGGKRVRTIETGPVRFPRFSPDGKILALQSDKQPWPFELWDVGSGKQLLSAGGDKAYFACLTFTPDGLTLITAGSSFNYKPPKIDQKITFWETATGKELRQIPMGTNNARKVVFSPNGNLMALICHGDKGKVEDWIRIFDVAAGKEIRQLIPTTKGTPHTSLSTALAFSPDGKTLYTGGIDQELIAWNPETGEELRRIGTGMSWSDTLAVSPDGTTLAAGEYGKNIRLIDSQSGKDKVRPAGHSHYILYTAASDDGRRIATGDTRDVFVWDGRTGKELCRLASDRPRSMQGLDGRAFLTVELATQPAQGQALRVHELETGKEIRSTLWGSMKDDPNNITMAVAPDGKTIAKRGNKGSAAILVDMETGREIRALGKAEQGKVVKGAKFAPNGRSLLIWGPDTSIRQWDVADGQLLAEFPGTLEQGNPRGPVPTTGRPLVSTVVSPDCTIVAAYQRDSDFIAFHDFATGKLIRRLDAIPGAIGPITFSPDSRSLAWAGSRDGLITLVELATGSQRASFLGHGGAVKSLAFSGDSKTLVSGADDTTALVWDLTGQHAGKSLAKKMTAVELNEGWNALAGEDASEAFQAIKRLAAAPVDSIPFLASKLSSVPNADEKHVARLVADLDSDVFAVRQAATKELEEIGEPAAGSLQKVVAGKSSLEHKQRAQLILDKMAQAWQRPGPTNLRLLRALEALELAGTSEARIVLGRLAGGAAGARMTQIAMASLERLAALSKTPR